MSKTKFLERFEGSGLNVPDHVWNKAINDDIKINDLDIFSNPKLSQEQLELGLTHGMWQMRSAAAKNPNITSDQLHTSLNDENEWVRRRASQNVSATHEHLAKALRDRDQRVRDAVSAHTPKHSIIDYIRRLIK